MMHSRAITLTVVLVVAVMLLGCPYFQKQATTFQQLNTKQKLTWAMGVYNAEFADYQFKSSLADLTDSERKVLQKKRDVLVQLHASIETLDKLYTATQMSDATQEQAILALITELERLVIRRIE